MKTRDNFTPRIFCYFAHTDTTAAKILKAAVPAGEVDIYSHRAEALYNLDPNSPGLKGTYYASFFKAANERTPESKALPKAYLFDLSIGPSKTYKGMSMAEKAIDMDLGKGNDENMQSVAAAIELILTHQHHAASKDTKPLIFIKQSSDSERIAHLISDKTGMDVHLFQGPIAFAHEAGSCWEPKVTPLESFTPLLEQTRKISPNQPQQQQQPVHRPTQPQTANPVGLEYAAA